MKLVEAEAVGPAEGSEDDEGPVMPPRPPHRRVSVSLIFTLTVLIGTVVTIYKVFPAREHVLLTETIERHRHPPQTWELNAPTPGELYAWALGVAGPDMPMPFVESAPRVHVIGARRIEVLDRDAALVRVELDGEPLTYLVQHATGIAPARTEQVDGDLRAVAWRRGKHILVIVGRDATAANWLSTVH